MVRRAGLPPVFSNESAVRWPVPVMRKAIAWPFVQPGRAMTSRTNADKSGVRWSGPLADGGPRGGQPFDGGVGQRAGGEAARDRGEDRRIVGGLGPDGERRF